MKAMPYAFVLEELQESHLAPQIRTRPMFGSLAVYAGERIVFILRRKQDPRTLRDDGVWVAMQPEHSAAIRKEFPILRPIDMFAKSGKQGFAGWLILPEDEDGFEEAALELCRLVIRGDPRFGKIPKPRRRSSSISGASKSTR